MIIVMLVILVLSASLHEFTHGWAAYNLGDPTAKLSGRLTLNPIAHLDLFGSLLLPLLLLVSGSPIIFASAKPVPINPAYFKNYRKDTLLTALSGPFSNFVIAIIFITALKIFLLLGGNPESLPATLMFLIVFVNVLLGTFNLIPIPPLDGSKFLYYIFSDNHPLIANLERMGFLILIVFLLLFGSFFDFILGSVLGLTFSAFGMIDLLPTFLKVL